MTEGTFRNNPECGFGLSYFVTKTLIHHPSSQKSISQDAIHDS
jgi:hypothetical protein